MGGSAEGFVSRGFITAESGSVRLNPSESDPGWYTERYTRDTREAGYRFPLPRCFMGNTFAPFAPSVSTVTEAELGAVTVAGSS